MKRMHGWKKMALLVATVGMLPLCLGASLVPSSLSKDQNTIQEDGDPRTFYVQPEEEEQGSPRNMPFTPDLSWDPYSWKSHDPTQELPVIPVE